MDLSSSRLLLAPIVLLLLWLSVSLGKRFQSAMPLAPEAEGYFNTILGASLTLLFLIIGFSFSLAASRYDQRKSLEEEEANAIGTEYTRVDVLPPADAARARGLLMQYLDQRILYYTTHDQDQLHDIGARTAGIELGLWSAVKTPASANPNAVSAITLTGMNDVLNSQGYTEAAWLNRIPIAAWLLMTIIAICSSLLTGFSFHHAQKRRTLLVFLPFIIAVAFYFIADIDSPRNGIIRVVPINLISLSTSLKGS